MNSNEGVISEPEIHPYMCIIHCSQNMLACQKGWAIAPSTSATVISGDDRNLSLLLLQRRRQTSDALLELAVLGRVDERVDAAVDERQSHAEVVEPTVEVERVADEVQKEGELGW